MKTLKKTLCLVLAVVMVVGVLILPAYAADDDYDDAIEALQSYGVLQGYPDGDPHTDANITRGQMAALVYRIMTGDTASTDTEVATKYGHYANIYTDADVAPWAKGYIGFCTNEGVLKGYPGGTVDANKQITGYEVQAMLLRALGYDDNGEYTGNNWQYKVLADATKAGITDGMTKDPSKVTPRGAVAQMTFNAACISTRVQYNAITKGYDPMYDYTSSVAEYLNLIEVPTAATKKTDKWGAPSEEKTITFTWPNYSKTATVTDKLDASGEYWTPVTECDVCADGGISTTAELEQYINGYKSTTKQAIEAIDTVNKIGAQGRWTRTFDVDGDGKIDRVVYVDILLAQVLKVNPQVTDAAGHEKTPATMDLHIYTTTETSVNSTKNYAVKGNDYAKGDYILLYALDADGNGAPDVTTSGSVTYLTYNELKGVAPTIVGAQTTIWANGNSHVIDGTEYPDNHKYNLDVAGNTPRTSYQWFLDGHGNVIGSIKPTASYNYAVLTSMIWVTGNPGHAEATLLYMDGTTKTVTVKSIAGDDGDKSVIFGGTWFADSFAPTASDGTSNEVKFAGNVNSTNDYVYVSAEGKNNAMFQGYALYTVAENSDGTVTLSATSYLNDTYAYVRNKGTAIVANNFASGTPGNVYVNDDTVFVARKVSNGTVSYDRYEGKDNVPSYNDANLTLFYVDTNNDTIAEYVYINQGTPTAATLSHLVVALSNKYSRELIDSKERYALDSAMVGGEVVPSGTVYDADGTYIIPMAGKVNRLFWVNYNANGAVIAAREVTSAGCLLSDGTTAGWYGGDAVFEIFDVRYASGLLIGICGRGQMSWDANPDTVKVYGKAKEDLATIDWTKVNAYAVVTGSKALKALYIFDKVDTGITPEGPKPPKGNVTLDLDMKGTGIGYSGSIEDVVVTNGTFTFVVTANGDVNDIDVSVLGSDGLNVPGVKVSVQLTDSGTDKNYFKITISGLPTASSDTNPLNYQVKLAVPEVKKGTPATSEEYKANADKADTKPQEIPSATWSAAEELYKNLGITITPSTTDSSVINITVDEDSIKGDGSTADPRMLMSNYGDKAYAELPETIAEGTRGYAGFQVGVAKGDANEVELKNIKVNGQKVANPAVSDTINGQAYLEFYTVIIYTGGAWTVNTTTYTIDFDAVATADGGAETTTHYTYTLNIKAA